MKLIKTKIWAPVDIACLKWSSIFFGMVVGAYLSDFTKHYVWVFAIVIVLLAIKPAVSYFKNNE